MKIRIIPLITLLAVLTSYMHGAGHKGSEALEILALIEGNYTYTFTENGETITGKLSADLIASDHFLKFDEVLDVSDPESVKVLGLVGYDGVEGFFTWHRIFSNAAYDFGRGRLRNGAITFNISQYRFEAFGDRAWGGPGIKLRTKWMNFTKNGWDVIWEQSKDGGPWEKLISSRMTKQ